MPLIGINNANPSQPKKSTLDKVAQGFGIANSVLGTALTAADIYNKYEQTDVARSANQINKANATSEYLKSWQPSTADAPGATKIDTTGTNLAPTIDDKYTYMAPKQERLKFKDFKESVDSGLYFPSTKEQVAEGKAKGDNSYTILPVEGGVDIPVRIDALSLQEKFKVAADQAKANLAKTSAETGKVIAETGAIGKEKEKEVVTAEDNLRQEIEKKPEVANFREAQAIGSMADALVKDGSPASQYALITGFIRSLAPGTVSEKETAAAGAGDLSQNVQRELAKAGFTTEKTVDQNGNPRIFLSEKSAAQIGRVISNNVAQRAAALKPTIDQYRKIAQERQLNADHVFLPFNTPDLKLADQRIKDIEDRLGGGQKKIRSREESLKILNGGGQ